MAKGCYCGTCATCRGTAPRPVVADPVAFRHGAIKHRMLTRIGSTEVDGSRPLNALGTRDDDDPAIALIDAFAGSMHILAWNVARLADDATIRRTEDRDALVDLTRLLGYEPRKKQVNFVVLQVGGFLGMGGHLVVVPYDSLVIDDKGQKITLPGASKDELKKLSEFNYPA
jgi:hypothetical protein